MLSVELKELFIRDLQRVKKEIALYETKAQLWVIDKGIKNSSGNLVLHLCGNLKHFIGAVLNQTGYTRDRNKEFSEKHVPVVHLHKNLDETIGIIENYFDEVDETKLNEPFPINVFKKEMTTRQMLMHLYGHLNYHLGQINYHRKLVDESKGLFDYAPELNKYIKPSEFIDSNHPDIINACNKIINECDSVQEKISQLYLYVRDKWRYNPYKLDLRKEQMKASAILKRSEAYCIEKAILYAALLRCAGIPAKVGFANVINHIGTEKLEKILKTSMLVFHGYTLVYFKNLWRVATPAFNKELCSKLNVDVLEFNGNQDSMLQQFNKEGNKYMEYVHDYGSFADLPHDLMISEFKKHYPHFENSRLPETGDLIFRV